MEMIVVVEGGPPNVDLPDDRVLVLVLIILQIKILYHVRVPHGVATV